MPNWDSLIQYRDERGSPTREIQTIVTAPKRIRIEKDRRIYEQVRLSPGRNTRQYFLNKDGHIYGMAVTGGQPQQLRFRPN